MSRRKKCELSDYQKQLRQYHKNSSRHVLVLEADIPYQDKCRIFHYADLERKAGNELVGIMKNNLEQLNRKKNTDISSGNMQDARPLKMREASRRPLQS